MDDEDFGPVDNDDLLDNPPRQQASKKQGKKTNPSKRILSYINIMTDSDDLYVDQSRFTQNKRKDQALQNEFDDDDLQDLDEPDHHEEEEELEDLDGDQDQQEEDKEASYYEEYNYESEEEKNKPKGAPPKKDSDNEYEEEFDEDQNYEEDDDIRDEMDDTFNEGPSNFENDQSKISGPNYKRQSTQQSSLISDRPALYKKAKLPPKQTYVQRYAKVIAKVDYSNWDDKQLLKENADLRQKLKEISEEVSKLVEKAASKPVVQGKPEISVVNKIKILREELKNNQKRLEMQKADMLKIKQRIEQVSSPKYFTDLFEDVKKLSKLIEDKKKKNRQDQLEQNKKGKNLDIIENVVGNPDNLVDKQKKAVELEMLQRKNAFLQEQIAKIRLDIDENQAKQPKIAQQLQEKIEAAVKLKIDVDPDQPMQKLRDQYFALERKKLQLQKFLETVRAKDGKVQVAEFDVKDLKRQIQQKNNDINMIEMQLIEQRKQVEDARNKLPESKFKMYMQAAQTQQNYNVSEEPQQKGVRKLVSAKPNLQSKPPIQKTKPNETSPREDIRDVSPQPSTKKTEPSYRPIEEQQYEESTHDAQHKPIKPSSSKPEPVHQQQHQQTKQVEPSSPKAISGKQEPAKPEAAEQPKPEPINKGPSKPFQIKKANKTDQPSTEPVKDQNALTFGADQPIQEETAKFTIGTEEQGVAPRRMIRMAKKPEDSYDQQQQPNQAGKNQTQLNEPLQPQQSMDTKILESQNPSQLSNQSYQPTNQNPYQPSSQTSYQPSSQAQQPQSSYNPSGLEGGQQEIQPSRRNRMLRNPTNNEQPDAYDPYSRNPPKASEPIKASNDYSYPQASEPQVNIGVGRRNRNLNDSATNNHSGNLDLQINEKGASETTLQKEQPVYNLNKSQQPQQEPQQQQTFNFNKQQTTQEQPSFNFNRQTTQNQQVQPQVKQEQISQQSNPQPQPMGGPGVGRRKQGPMKRDIWNEEPSQQQTDVYNIKSIDEPEPKPQVTTKKVINDPPQYQQEEDKEMTLDEILGKNGTEQHQDVQQTPVEYAGNNNRRKNQQVQPQISQADKQRQLASKAENDDFFDEFEV